MPSRSLPNLGLQGFFDPGENGWDDEMSLNLLLLSVLTQAGVLEMVSATPGSPSNGDVYLFDETHPTQANKIAIRDDGEWIYVTPLEGWRVYDRNANVLRLFNGTVWAEFTSGGGGGGIEEAPEDGLLYGRRDAAWEEITGGGGGGGGGGGLVLIEEFVATGGETSFSLLDIPNIYKGLRIFTFARGQASANDVGLDLVFNDDAGTNYSYRQSFAPSGAVVSTNSTSARTVQFAGANAPVNRFDTGVLDIPFYASTEGSKSGVFNGQNTEGSSQYRNIYGSFNWQSLDAINKITFQSANGGFEAGSRIAVYGYGTGSSGGGSVGVETTVPTATNWRLRFPDSSRAAAVGTSFGVGLSELRWLDTDLTTQLATGGTPLASSTFSAGSFALSELYDGSTASGNGWYASEFPSGSFNAWCGYEFASAVKPAAISFAPLHGFLDTLPRAVVVEFLDSSGVWQPVAIYYPAPGANDTFQTFTIPDTFIKMPADGGAKLWAGQGVAVIGDSITEQTPGGFNWVVELRKILGLSAAPVDGDSGTTMASVAGRIAALDLSSADTLLIFMGTNDYGNSGGRALGAFGDDGADNTFYGDVYEAIDAAYTAKPSIRLIFVTPIQRTDQTAANAQGKVLRDYVDAIVDSCERYSVPVYDANRQGGFNALNFSTFSSDGLHPNGIGHLRLARNVAGFLLGL